MICMRIFSINKMQKKLETSSQCKRKWMKIDASEPLRSPGGLYVCGFSVESLTILTYPSHIFRSEMQLRLDGCAVAPSVPPPYRVQQVPSLPGGLEHDLQQRREQKRPPLAKNRQSNNEDKASFRKPLRMRSDESVCVFSKRS